MTGPTDSAETLQSTGQRLCSAEGRSLEGASYPTMERAEAQELRQALGRSLSVRLEFDELAKTWQAGGLRASTGVEATILKL